MEIEILDKWESACHKLATVFLTALYGAEKPEWFWVGDEVGGVLTWGDWFVSMDNMADYFRYRMTPDEFFAWYDQWIYQDDEKKQLNIRHFMMPGVKR